MTGLQTLVARSALGVVAGIVGYSAACIDRFKLAPARTFNKWALSAFVASRLGIYGVVFLVLHVAPRGDIPAYYFPEAISVLCGKLPYRDFPSSYAPLHAYLDAFVILLWRSPLAIILFAILADLILLWAWTSFARKFLSEQQARAAIILYIACPVALQTVAIDGQDNVIIAALLALGLLLIYRNRDAASGSVVALAIVFIKFLPLLYVPVFLLTARRPLRWLAGCLGVLVVGYGSFSLMNLPVLFPFRTEGHEVSAGNLPYLIEAATAVPIPPLLSDAVLVVAMLLTIAATARALRGASLAVRMRVATFAIAALTLALMALAKKSWPNYLMLSLFPICLCFYQREASRLRLAAFFLFSMVAVVEHSLWASLLALAPALPMHSLLVSREPLALLFLLLQALLIGGYAWLFAESIHQIRLASRNEHLASH